MSAADAEYTFDGSSTGGIPGRADRSFFAGGELRWASAVLEVGAAGCRLSGCAGPVLASAVPGPLLGAGGAAVPIDAGGGDERPGGAAGADVHPATSTITAANADRGILTRPAYYRNNS